MAGGGDEGLNALLLTLTGGLTLAPTCTVFWHYLTSTVWRPLGPALVAQPVNWRGRHLIWYLLLFTISLWLQQPARRALPLYPFCLALPIIALARHYGWQNALIATLMNAIALIASQTRTITRSIYCFPCWHRASPGCCWGGDPAATRAESVITKRAGA